MIPLAKKAVVRLTDDLAASRPSAESAELPATKVNPKDGAEMVLIPAGPFRMGDDKKLVTLSAYYLYKNLVTVGMYEKFCKDTGRQMPSAPSFNPDWSKKDHPIVNVSWDDAKAYCDWAGAALPTEEQWEKAARGVSGRQYPWGDAFDTSKLQCSRDKYGDAGGTAAVGSYPLGASPYGIMDMAGNVWQWCADWYDEKKNTRVVRGGSWGNSGPVNFRSPYRVRFKPTSRVFINGFRGCASPGLP